MELKWQKISNLQTIYSFHHQKKEKKIYHTKIPTIEALNMINKL